MSTFGFEVTVLGLTGEVEQVDRLYSPDVQIVSGIIDGVGHLDVEVEASTSEQALLELDCHLRSKTPEVTVLRIDEDLVTVSEIAERTGQSRETVRLWSTGKRRRDFPAHRAVLSGGIKIWPWGSVLPWLSSNGLVKDLDVLPLSTESIDWFNGQLVTRRREPALELEPFPASWQVAEMAPVEMFTLGELSRSRKSQLRKVKPVGQGRVLWDAASA